MQVSTSDWLCRCQLTLTKSDTLFMFLSLKPKATNGVMILPLKPVPREILSVEYNDTESSVSVIWRPFDDPYQGINFEVINEYAIAIFARTEHTRELHQLTKWSHLTTGGYSFNAERNEVHFMFLKIGALF